MGTTRRIQTAFRQEESLLNRLKRKVSFPIPHSARVSRMLDILPGFTEEDLAKDEKLAYILGK